MVEEHIKHCPHACALYSIPQKQSQFKNFLWITWDAMLKQLAGLLLIIAAAGKIGLAEKISGTHSQEDPNYVNGLYFGKW
jgi:hypothetical protein